MLNSGRMIVNRQPIPALLPVAIERKRLSVDRIRGKQGNEFLGILIRAIGIAATGDHDRKPVGGPVTQDEQIPAGLAGRIGAARLQSIAFRGTPLLDTAVHFIGADLQEPLHPCQSRLFQKNACPHHIGAGKSARIENRTIDVGLCGAVDDALNPVFLKRGMHRLLITDIRMDETVLRMAGEVRQIFQVAGILQRIEIHDRMAAALNQATHQMRSDEPGTSRDKNTHLKLHPIRSGLRHKLVRRKERFNRAGIRPPPLQHIPRQLSGGNVGVVDIGNL